MADKPGAMTRWERLRLHTFGEMRVVATDQGAGRKYECPCGWSGWSAWGHARKHAESCEKSGRVEDPDHLSPARPERGP